MTSMKLNPKRTTCFLILSLSFVLVTTQGISINFSNFSAEGSQLLKNEVPRIIEIQGDKNDDAMEITVPEINKESEGTFEGTNQSLNNLLGSSNQGDTEGANQTNGGFTGGLLSDETMSEGTNQTDTDTSDEESNGNTTQTEQTEDKTNNQDVNIKNTIINKQRLDIIISEEEDEAPISVEEQIRIESQDKDVVGEHRGISGPECRTGDVLEGASNAEDLRVLAECQDAIGTVMHTKKMDDGDYKFFLKLDEQFKFLVNEKNDDKTDGFLVVEIVPPDQDIQGVYLPKDGDNVHIWGAWVTDKPKGWHEIHPTWKIVQE